jgi:hypothetical protein
MSLVAPVAVWDDEGFSRAPHNVAAAAIAYYVESRRRCRLLKGCERVRGLGIAYWPFYISRRHDGRLVIVDLLGLHSFRIRLLELRRIAEIAAFASAAAKVGAGHVNEFMGKLLSMLSENIASSTVEFRGLTSETDPLEQLTLIARDGAPSSGCVMPASIAEGEAEDTLLRIDVLCDNLLEEYRMLEQLYGTITATIARMDSSIHDEMRRVVSEYTRAVRAIQARIDARMASVRGEIAREVEEVWEKYSRKLGEISARLDTARRMGAGEEAERLERMLAEVRREYEREARSIEKRYNSVAAGEIREIEALEREKEEKLASLRGELESLHRLSTKILSMISKLLDQLVEIRSRLCSAGAITPYALESDRARLYVPVAVAQLDSKRHILIPILAVSPEPNDPTPVRPLVASRALVDMLERDGSKRWMTALKGECQVGSGFKRMVRDGLRVLEERGILAGGVAEKVWSGVERFWLVG